jgi:hypothetical protein
LTAFGATPPRGYGKIDDPAALDGFRRRHGFRLTALAPA